MSQLISARIPESTAERLKRYAQRKKRSLNEIAGLVLEEWLRQDEFPHVEFRDTPDGTRRACMKNSRLPVCRVIQVARERGFDIERVREFWPERSAEWVRAALHYYVAGPFAHWFVSAKLRMDPIYAGLLAAGESMGHVVDIGCGRGQLGALLLVRTSDQSFLRLLPWLMAIAAATFTVGGEITAWARGRRKGVGGSEAPVADAIRGVDGSTGGVGSVLVPLWTLPLQLLIAIYGGYFGGGMGIMMLAGMSVAGMTDMHEMNGLKAVLAIAINGIALITFVSSGAIAWAPGLVMVVGGISGGYLGATTARKISGTRVRPIVIAIAWTMTAYFFLR